MGARLPAVRYCAAGASPCGRCPRWMPPVVGASSGGRGSCLRPSWKLSPVVVEAASGGRRIPELSISMCLNRRGTSIPRVEADTTLKYTEDQPEQFTDEPVKSHPTAESVDGKLGMGMHDHKESASQQRKGAKIHDFCLGIPFGGLVFGGGLVGFLFSRSPASLTTGMLFGGAILALGVFSLKVWRKGRSSLPFILGQAAIAATLVWKHFQLYSLTKKLFPSGFYVFISAAMLCFYSYVLISGGNPPPKKLATTPPS